MAGRHVLTIAVGAGALLWSSSLSTAQEYRPDEFFSLDLSRAALSPRPLGPAQSFAPGPLDVRVDDGSNTAHVVAEAPVEAKPKGRHHFATRPPASAAVTTAGSAVHSTPAHARQSAPHAPRSLIALHRRNPLEAQARDTGIQVWPCKSGGICNWKR